MCGWELVGGDSFGCLVVETGEVNGSFLMIVRLVFCSGQITSFLLFTLGIIVGKFRLSPSTKCLLQIATSFIWGECNDRIGPDRTGSGLITGSDPSSCRLWCILLCTFCFSSRLLSFIHCLVILKQDIFRPL